MMSTRRSFVAGFAWCAVFAALLWFIFSSENPISFFFGMQHAVREEERFVLYHVDHAAVAAELRQLAEQRGWSRFDMSASDPAFPSALRTLKAEGVWAFQDYIELEFGGAFGDIGLRAYRPGLPGSGTKKLGDGVWFYSEDGNCPDP